MLSFIPEEVKLSETDVWGDWEKLFESVESGFQAEMWDRLIAYHELMPAGALRYSLQGAIIPGCI